MSHNYRFNKDISFEEFIERVNKTEIQVRISNDNYEEGAILELNGNYLHVFPLHDCNNSLSFSVYGISNSDEIFKILSENFNIQLDNLII